MQPIYVAETNQQFISFARDRSLILHFAVAKTKRKQVSGWSYGTFCFAWQKLKFFSG